MLVQSTIMVRAVANCCVDNTIERRVEVTTEKAEQCAFQVVWFIEVVRLTFGNVAC